MCPKLDAKIFRLWMQFARQCQYQRGINAEKKISLGEGITNRLTMIEFFSRILIDKIVNAWFQHADFFQRPHSRR